MPKSASWLVRALAAAVFATSLLPAASAAASPPAGASAPASASTPDSSTTPAVKAKPPRPAVISAAVACNDLSCKGKNPQTSGCNSDARTLQEFTYNIFRVELRQSDACWAAWTRITSPSNAAGSACNTAFAQIAGYTAADVFKGSYGKQAVCPGQTYTVMWPFSDFVRGCYGFYFSGAEVCTPRR